MLAIHDAITTDARKDNQKLSKLVNQGHHAVRTAHMGQLPNSTPARTGRPTRGQGEQGFRQGSPQEPTRGRSQRTPSCVATGLAPCHTPSVVRGHRKALHGD